MSLSIAAIAVFWTCLFWCVYVYVLYPLLLLNACAIVQARRDWTYFSHRGDRRHRNTAAEGLPFVSIVIPVHNEANHLREKLENLRALDYPADRLEAIFISDGSTDESNAILQAEAAPFRVVINSRQQGKAETLNRGVALASHPILVLCDAATILSPDAVRQLVRHFEAPHVGAVCGALQFRANAESRRTEGLYWRYESTIRLMEARLGATLTASGALYALRRECYRPLQSRDLLDDFVIPMNARALGYAVHYDPEATAVDVAGSSIEEEFTRRVRLAVGSFRALVPLLRVPLNWRTRWALLSHKVGRWLLPFVLLPMLVATLLLVPRPVYTAALAAQVGFYLLALLGMWLRRNGGRAQVKIASLAYYLLAMNAAFVVGFALLVFRHGETKWQRAQ